MVLASLACGLFGLGCASEGVVMLRLLFVAVLMLLVGPGSPGAAELSVPSYQRHVTALFGKLGCNGGTCHGAVKGQNGFRLSMFGADPTGDHERLLHEYGGRRLNFSDPASSLLLLKATGQVPHGGGARLKAGSDEHRILQAWIANGAMADEVASSRVKRLNISPAERVMQPGETYRMKVEAEFSDGSTEDITEFCLFESLDQAVATVDRAGVVTGVGVGDAGLMVRYRAQPAAARVLVPRKGTNTFPKVISSSFVDDHVLAKLRRLNLLPAELCDDATFLRRVHLDVVGELPTPDEVRSFLAGTSTGKRAAKIEELLLRPGHADLWTLKFCDLLKAADFGVYADALSKEHDAPRMQAWVRARLHENIPYDEFVERILLATSREGRTMEEYVAEVNALFEGYAPGRPDLELYARRRTLDLFWQRRGSDGVKGTMQVAHAFLGLRIECAQCHRHPHDNWQQEDLLDFANLFMRVRTVGFSDKNEKLFPDAATHFKQMNEEAKRLEADVKQREEGEGKKLEEDGRKAKQEADKLTAEIARLEKTKGDESDVAKKRDLLTTAKEVQAQAESYRQETAARDKRAKQMVEAARRLMQAEARLLDKGENARVTSTLGSRESKIFRLLGESEPIVVPADRDPRELVMEWMRKPDNPYFARAIVNRVWAHYFGRGIIDPPDNLSAFNPATHPELLKELCDGFIENKFDLRWLHRTILKSRTYQQSSTPAEGSAADRTHYAFFPMRRLPAEVLLDALNTATGTTENMDMKYHHWPDTISTVQVPFMPQNKFVSFVLETYGRPQRNAAVQCDCERDNSGSIFHVLMLSNHPRVWEKIRDPAGRSARLIKAPGDITIKIDDIFLATISRLPTDQERNRCVEFMTSAENSETALQDVLWCLINTREFLLQH